MAPVFALILISFLLAMNGLTGHPIKQQIEISCENCSTTVAPDRSSTTAHPRPIAIQVTTDGPAVLVVIEEDSSSDSSEEVIIGELIEEGNNTTLSSSEEEISYEQIKSAMAI